MNAIEEIRNLALMFQWESHTDNSRRQDTFIHGQHMVTVDYRRDGAVNQAQRYEFASIKHPKLCESAYGRDKKSDVRYWLVKLGH